MSYLYLLESLDTKHKYLGSTPDIDLRFENHNFGFAKATKHKGPWKILKTWTFETIKEARQIEYKIKQMKRKLSIEYVDYFIINKHIE